MYVWKTVAKNTYIVCCAILKSIQEITKYVYLHLPKFSLIFFPTCRVQSALKHSCKLCSENVFFNICESFSYDFFYSSFWCPPGSQLIFYVISFQAALPAVQVLCRKPHLGFLRRSKPVLSWGECTVPLQCNATYFNGEVSIPQENMLQHVHWQTLRLPSASTLPSAGLGTEDSHCWWQQHCFVIKGFSPQASFRLTCCYTEQTIFCEFFLTRFFKLLFMGLNTAWWRNNSPQSPCQPRTNKSGLQLERCALPSLLISVC